jgi:hypothetical protein
MLCGDCPRLQTPTPKRDVCCYDQAIRDEPSWEKTPQIALSRAERRRLERLKRKSK